MKDGESHPDRIVARGRPEAYMIQRIVGWFLLIAGGCTFAGGALVTILGTLSMMVGSAIGVSSPEWTTVFVTLWLVLASGALAMAGLGAVHEVRQLDGLRLIIDDRGITNDGVPEFGLPWSQIRHIAVSKGRPGFRRLKVDDGTGPEATAVDASDRLGALLRRRQPQFALSLSIDRLDVEAGDLIRAIRHHSRQRLPDL